VLVPGRGGIGLVEPHAERDLLPEPLDVGLAEDLLSPALARSADAAPVEHVVAEVLHLDAHELLLHRSTDALAVEVGEQIRLGITRRADHRVAGPRAHESLLPVRRVGQRLVRPQLDHRPARVSVAVDDVDVGGAGAVRLPGQGARELVVLDRRKEEDLLARLDIRADRHDELRVALEAFVHRRRSYVIR
jgi:hypothetical protein